MQKTKKQKEKSLSHKMPDSACPHCCYALTAASSPTTEKKPRPGDFSVCAKCQTFLVFQDDLVPRIVTEEEISEWSLSLRKEMVTYRETLSEYNANAPCGGFGSKGER